MSLDRLVALEQALGLRAGQLAREAGYLEPGGWTAARIVLTEVEDPEVGFPSAFVRWMEEFSTLIDAILVLDDLCEPDAAAVLRALPTVVVLRVSWELCEGLSDVPVSDLLCPAVPRQVVERCQAALWPGAAGAATLHEGDGRTLRLVE